MQSFIGVFDSGMGGITVLADLVEAMPEENFIYFGDSANAPYGTKDPDQVLELTDRAVGALVGRGAKLVVIACNTATSVAVDRLREKYPVPIVGMEPAVKPAVESEAGGDVAVLATPMTLRLDKFNHLVDRLGGESARILKIPAPELVELIEHGTFEGEQINSCLRGYFKQVDRKAIRSVVLGCTHYLYLKDAIRHVLGDQVVVYDGNRGTVNRVIQILEERDLVGSEEHPQIVIENSGPPSMVDQSIRLYKAYQRIKRERINRPESGALQREKVRALIESAPIEPRYKEMILLRYGLLDEPAYTAEQFGKKYRLRGKRLREELDKLERMTFNILKSENIYDIISQN